MRFHFQASIVNSVGRLLKIISDYSLVLSDKNKPIVVYAIKVQNRMEAISIEDNKKVME